MTGLLQEAAARQRLQRPSPSRRQGLMVKTPNTVNGGKSKLPMYIDIFIHIYIHNVRFWTCTYLCIYVYACVYICIHILHMPPGTLSMSIERVRGRERERERDTYFLTL